MTLALVLLALLVDRVLFDPDALRARHQFDTYHRRTCAMIAGATSAPALLQLLALLPLVVLAWLALWLTGTLFGNWIAALLGAGMLLYALGPKDLGREVERYLQARDAGNLEQAGEVARALGAREPSGHDPQLSCEVARATGWAANQRLFAPIFWFVIGGPVGALLYRLAHQQSTALPATEAAPEGASAQPLIAWLDWLPARALAASMALVGNFEGVALAWQSGSAALSEAANRFFLHKAVCSAVDSFPDEQGWDLLDETPPVVEDVMALVWRMLGIWLVGLLLVALLGLAF